MNTQTLYSVLPFCPLQLWFTSLHWKYENIIKYKKIVFSFLFWLSPFNLLFTVDVSFHCAPTPLILYAHFANNTRLYFFSGSFFICCTSCTRIKTLNTNLYLLNTETNKLRLHKSFYLHLFLICSLSEVSHFCLYFLFSFPVKTSLCCSRFSCL